LDVRVSASGTTTIDNPIYIKRLQEHFAHLAANAQGEFGASAELSVFGKEVGRFHLSGATAGNLEGPLSFSGGLHIGKLPLLNATGGGYFSPSQFSVKGSFSSTLPPLALARGTLSFDQNRGFSAEGNYVGVLVPGINGLSPGINPTALPAGAPGEPTGPRNVPTYSLEPSVGYGFTHFSVSPQQSFSISVGATFKSEYVPYFSGGASQPFTGPSGGAYFGAAARGSF
jgi:hypothetical protein